jgi:L-alanine-DL-glutamate epimerase-like enolase superfamily enzyme
LYPLRVFCRRLRLQSPFGISRGVRAEVENVFIAIAGHWGEAAPVTYHGQTAELLEDVASSIRVPDSFDQEPGRLIHDIASQIRGIRPILTAIDMAAHDAWATRQGKSLSQLWEIDERDAPPSSFTIGLDTPERMAEKIKSGTEYPILKIKLGSPDDLACLTAIRQATDKKIRVDANEGWDRETAAWWMQRLPDWNVDLVEQPLPRDDREGLRDLVQRNKGRVPIILDESVQTSRDIPQVLGLADGINIKLAKCGGLVEARCMMSLARRHGLLVMVGCMLESSLGISAAAHIAPLADFVDLDGAALLAEDPFDGVRFEEGQVRFRDRPGLGVVLRSDAGFEREGSPMPTS